jgi:hypothetical protein
MTHKTASKKTAVKNAAKTTKTTPKAKAAPNAQATPSVTPVAETEPVIIEAEKIEQAEKPTSAKAAKPERPASQRYEIACLEVSTANKAFHAALQERCRLMGTSLKGESCGIRNASPELAALNEQIKFAKQGLQILGEERRKLMTVSPELEAVNLKIAGLRKQRSIARAEKKAAAAEIGL